MADQTLHREFARMQRRAKRQLARLERASAKRQRPTIRRRSILSALAAVPRLFRALASLQRGD